MISESSPETKFGGTSCTGNFTGLIKLKRMEQASSSYSERIRPHASHLTTTDPVKQHSLSQSPTIVFRDHFNINLKKVAPAVPKNVIGSYMLFFLFQMLTNALFLILMGVHAFSDHDLCTSVTGYDVTERFTTAFRIGFFLHAAIFIN